MSAAVNSDSSELARRTRHAVMWNSGLVTLINVGQFGIMLVLVRLLSPEVYGQYGLLMGLIGFIYVFSAQGLVDFALQVRDERQLHWQELFTISVLINTSLWAVTNIVAVTLSHSEAYAGIAVPLHWLSFSLLLQPPRAVRIAMLKRDLDWRRIRLLHFIGFVLSAALSIPLAIAGAGIYALLISAFVVPMPFIYDIFIGMGWRPSWPWNVERMKPAIEFGLNRILSGLLVAGRPLLESALVVQLLGFASYGILGRAVSLADIFCNRLLGHALEALYPALTKIHVNSERFRRVAELVLRSAAWFCIPTAILLAKLSTFLVLTLYGQKWLEVIPLMHLAFAVAATGAIRHTLYKLMLAHEQKHHCLVLDLLLLLATMSALVFLLDSGLIAYLRGLIAAQIVLIATAYWLLAVHNGLNFSAFPRTFIPPLFAGVAAILFADGVARGVDLPVNSPLYILLYATTFSMAYLAIVRSFFSRLLAEVVSQLPFQRGVKRVLLMT